ncbi:low temperature requirement protein A [Streptomyces sp. NPDC056713]|uniref:low temperature requirement protein A n=1 Tax=Streptomyces sp. NPDC056713 TaxID=3345921 RepID=UPI0036984514
MSPPRNCGSARWVTVAPRWTYFVRDEGAAEATFLATSPARRFRLAMNAYYYAFLPMLLGVAFLAAGVKMSLGHLGEHLHTGPALALAGGVALFLAGDVAFRTAMRLSPPAFRAAAVPVVLGAAPLGTHVAAVAELVALVVILVAMPAAEARACRGVPAGDGLSVTGRAHAAEPHMQRSRAPSRGAPRP